MFVAFLVPKVDQGIRRSVKLKREQICIIFKIFWISKGCGHERPLLAQTRPSPSRTAGRSLRFVCSGRRPRTSSQAKRSAARPDRPLRRVFRSSAIFPPCLPDPPARVRLRCARCGSRPMDARPNGLSGSGRALAWGDGGAALFWSRDIAGAAFPEPPVPEPPCQQGREGAKCKMPL